MSMVIEPVREAPLLDEQVLEALVVDLPTLDDLFDGDGPISDEELTALALAADPDAPLPPDSVPWSSRHTGLLPDWYMPGSVARRRGGWRAAVALAVVVGLVAINAAGLCITYGHLVIA